MKTVPLTRRDLRQLRRFIARPPKPTQALMDLMRNTPRQPTVEETLRAEIARLQRIADHAPGFEVPIIASLRAENAALEAKLAERPTNTSERERVARAYVTHKGWDWYQAECDEDAGCCQCLSCYYQGSLTIPDVREAEMQAADAAIAAMDRPTTSASVVDAVDWATKMIEKTGVESAADYYWLDSRPGKPPHSAPPTQSQEVRMVDPMIPGLDAAVEAAVNELRLTYNEGPGDLYDLVHDALTAALSHLIEPAIKAAREDMRERCAMTAAAHGAPNAAKGIRALPLTDPTGE